MLPSVVCAALPAEVPHVPVAIVGAGACGLTAALMLAAVATVFSGCHSQQELVIQTTQDAAKARIGGG